MFIGLWLETSPAKASMNVEMRRINTTRALGDWIVVDANHGSEAVVASARRAIEARGHSFVYILCRA